MTHPRELPEASPDALAHSARLVAHLRESIRDAGGWIPFSAYMEAVLYAPGLGYYTAGSRKLGAEGDFTTAPELSPLFGHTLAQQARELIVSGLGDILEVGAGSGALAAAMLEELDRLGCLPERYFILELSPDLRARERDTLAARVPHLLERVVWLNQLPPSFRGVVIGNEVLDAMPVEIVHRTAEGYQQAGVDADFVLRFRPARGELAKEAEALALPLDYLSEIALVARAFVATLANVLEQGVLLFVDYGFPQREFYHPQRTRGTLMCHYRHRAHADPFFLPGLQDITAHLDFTALARTADDAGLEVLGYCGQAQFLINCGITELLQRAHGADARARLELSAVADKLLSPAEMGELFKAIAFGRGVESPLLGFRSGNRQHTL